MHTVNDAGDEIGRQVTRHAIPWKVLLTLGRDSGEGGRPNPRGKLRFLHVALDPVQFTTEFRSCSSARKEGGEEVIHQAGS